MRGKKRELSGQFKNSVLLMPEKSEKVNSKTVFCFMHEQSEKKGTNEKKRRLVNLLICMSIKTVP